MHGFITSPALAKLVALQMVDEQIQTNSRTRPRKTGRAAFRVRFQALRASASSARPVPGRRVSPTGSLVEESR